MYSGLARGASAIVLLLALSLYASEFSYKPALPGYRYNFPRDHFEHPDFRTEWWYYTGNVHDSAGKRFGFELVFFRQGERCAETGAAKISAWSVDDLYLGHLALTDIDGHQFYYTERLNRAGPGIAGASFEQRRIWNGNWSAAWDGERQKLSALADDFSFTLSFDPAKPLVIHGENGVSQKSEGAGRASYYVSFPRLTVAGKITLHGADHAVSGTAWMDHEWFTHQLEPNQTGWDWFSVQLENNTELMLFELRRKDGSIDPYSSGTFVDAAGRAHHLTARDFSLQRAGDWKSGQTGARYPVRWQIRIPSLNIALECKAALDSQERKARQGPSYWEGAVSYSGSSKGVGYLEMTGYDRAVRLE